MTKWFDRLHMPIHFIFGVLIAVVVSRLTGTSWARLLPLSVIGSFLPDLDHLLFFFTYGRSVDYSKRVKFHLRQKQIKQAIRFCAHNHKQLYGLHSHTWYGVMIIALGELWSWKHSYSLRVLFLAMLAHFLYDIAEDFMLHGKLNPNWKGKVMKHSFIDEFKDSIQPRV